MAVDRESVVASAIAALESGSIEPPARIGQDALALADTLRQANQAGSARAFFAFKTAQRLLAADEHGKVKDKLPERPRGPHPYPTAAS